MALFPRVTPLVSISLQLENRAMLIGLLRGLYRGWRTGEGSVKRRMYIVMK